MHNHAFLTKFSKVCALPTSHAPSLDFCTGPILAPITVAYMTLT